MMAQKQLNLFNYSLNKLLSEIQTCFSLSTYDYKKHQIIIIDQQNVALGYIRLPLSVSVNSELTITEKSSVIIYLSIESDYAAICVMKGKEEVYHKAFSAYMTRKKQGFNQIKYLNKKGKSRAGSRVRLAATFQFFESINTTLTQVFNEYQIARIGINCNPSLIPYLHQSKISCPFDKKDERLYKIPLHIQKSNYSNLNAAVKKLIAPILFYQEEHEKKLEKVIAISDP